MMKAALVPILPLLLWSCPVTGEEAGLDDVKVGDHVTQSHAAGFLKYRGVHSGVKVYGLSTDVGSAMPSEDFRLYAENEHSKGLLVSLGMRSRQGYRCVVEGDTMKLFVTKGMSREAVSKVPIAVIDLKQLISGFIEQGDTGRPLTRSQSKQESGDKPQTESEGRSR